MALAGLAPALAGGEPARTANATFVVFDDGYRDGSQADPSDSTVEIAPGGTVSFAYPSGASSHNVVFDAAQPSSCVQDAGVVITTGPPLPAFAQPPGWSGECTFAAPGTYTFFCNAHPTTMHGTVIVEDAATPTPTATVTATATAPPEPTPVATPVATPAPTPDPWAAIDAPAKKAASVSAFARGKLRVSARCSAPSSGTLSLTVSKADAKRLKLKGVELARAKAQCTGAGRVSVTLKPSAKAKRALRHWKRALKTTVTLTLGSAKASRRITLARAR